MHVSCMFSFYVTVYFVCILCYHELPFGRNKKIKNKSAFVQTLHIYEYYANSARHCSVLLFQSTHLTLQIFLGKKDRMDRYDTIRYDTIRYIYLRSNADKMASLV